MKRRLLFMAVASAFVAALWALPASAGPLPSGERINGGTNGNGGTVIEPVYDDMTGQIRYVSTPRGVPNPVKSNPIASAPFYLPVYPGNAAVGTLNCQDQPTENCPDHGPAVAGLAELLQPGVYNATNGGVLGHDHLMAGPGSGGDFNVAWVPTLVLFTKPEYVQHITLLSPDIGADAGFALAMLDLRISDSVQPPGSRWANTHVRAGSLHHWTAASESTSPGAMPLTRIPSSP